MRWLRSKRTGPVLGASLLALSMATVVLAGSATHNPLNNATRGWTTSNFWDTATGLDAGDSVMFFEAACDDQYSGTTNNQEWARLQLLRFAGIFPWEDRGQTQKTCGNGIVDFDEGIQPGPAEWFKWHLMSFSGSGNTLDVPDPGLKWEW